MQSGPNNRDEIGSLNHYRMQIYTTINVWTTNKMKQKKNKQKKEKITEPSLRYLNLDDS